MNTPPPTKPTATYRSLMCPTVRALTHLAVGVLQEWATFGCPTRTGNPWTKQEIWEAVKQGPHQSALMPEAIAHFAEEAAEKVHTNQTRIMAWDDIKDNPPRELKISPIAAIPHKSKAFCSILDLSFRVKLKNGGGLASVNNTMGKTAPKGAIDQIGDCLSQIIHAFAEADETAKIFMEKWDIKDGFWRLDCTEGEEYNFAYVLPQPEEEPTQIVIPTLLKMGWVESPLYFCVAMETAGDVAKEYIKMPVTSLCNHKFVKYTIGDKEYEALPAMIATITMGFMYMVEVYVDDFMSLMIPVSQEQLQHVAMAVMMEIH
jgi:hypothetical protein